MKLEKIDLIAIITMTTIIILFLFSIFYDYNFGSDFYGIRKTQEIQKQLMQESDKVCKYFGLNNITHVGNQFRDGYTLECDNKYEIKKVIIENVFKCLKYNQNGACISGDLIYQYQKNTGHIQR